MAKLTTCGTCGHQVSSTATQCPNCGQKFKKKTSIFTWVIAGVIGMPFLFALFKGAGNEQSSTVQQQSVISSTSIASSPSMPESNWGYDVDTDKMRGTKVYYAGTASINNADFQFPYNGESHLHIQIRKMNDKNEVLLTIDKGQFDCGMDDCIVAIKFDNEAIKNYSFGEADSGRNDVLFLHSDVNAFINKLKKSNTVTVEPKFFQEGKRQFEFKTSGLEWKH